VRLPYNEKSVAGVCHRRGVTALLFAEDFLYVAHLLLNFAGDFLVGTTISQIGIAESFSGLLFNFAFRFPDAALDFVSCARFHEHESLRPALPGGLFG